MTSIRAWARDGARGLEISGHAGYAASGADIVCAGVSGMCYLLSEASHALVSAGILSEAEVRVGEGTFSIRLVPRGAGAETARCLVEGALAAGERMAAQYPGYVEVDGA